MRTLCGEISGANYLEADGAALGDGSVSRLLASRPELLVVVGGDGTLHGVLNHLFAPQCVGPLPALLVVPAGTTNMSALDLGVSGAADKVLLRLRDKLAQSSSPAWSLTSRPILQVEAPAVGCLCGMFFGAGIIARGVQYFTSHIRTRGITGEAASALVVARFLAALLGADRGGLTAPVPATPEGLPGLSARQPYVAILASVLDRLLLGMRPYWGAEAAPIHVTAVKSHPGKLYRSLFPLLSGRGATLRGEEGYASANVQAMAVKLEGPFVIDGQCYDARGETLALSVAGQINFLQL